MVMMGGGGVSAASVAPWPQNAGNGQGTGSTASGVGYPPSASFLNAECTWDGHGLMNNNIASQTPLIVGNNGLLYTVFTVYNDDVLLPTLIAIDSGCNLVYSSWIENPTKTNQFLQSLVLSTDGSVLVYTDLPAGGGNQNSGGILTGVDAKTFAPLWTAPNSSRSTGISLMDGNGWVWSANGLAGTAGLIFAVDPNTGSVVYSTGLNSLVTETFELALVVNIPQAAGSGKPVFFIYTLTALMAIDYSGRAVWAFESGLTGGGPDLLDEPNGLLWSTAQEGSYSPYTNAYSIETGQLMATPPVTGLAAFMGVDASKTGEVIAIGPVIGPSVSFATGLSASNPSQVLWTYENASCALPGAVYYPLDIELGFVDRHTNYLYLGWMGSFGQHANNFTTGISVVDMATGTEVKCWSILVSSIYRMC